MVNLCSFLREASSFQPSSLRMPDTLTIPCAAFAHQAGVPGIHRVRLSAGVPAVHLWRVRRLPRIHAFLRDELQGGLSRLDPPP